MNVLHFFRHSIGLGLTSAIVCLAGTLAARGEDWNQWRGPNRNGVDPSSLPLIESLPADGLKALWTSENIPSGGNGGWGSPVVSAGKVYLFAHFQTRKPGVNLPPPKFPALNEDERKKLNPEALEKYEKQRQEEESVRRSATHDFREIVYCFDATSGKTLWKNEKLSVHTDVYHSGTPAVVGGRLYILGAGAVARCIDAQGGKTLWETPLIEESTSQSFMSSFAVADGVAVVLAGRPFGLDAKTGRLLWKGDAARNPGTHSSPAVWRAPGGDLILFNVGGHETVCIQPQDGGELWRVDSQANVSTPVVVGDKLLTLGDSRKKGLRCFKLTREGAEPLWTYQGLADRGSNPVIVGGHVYAQGERRVACVDVQTGEAAWTAELDLDNPQYTSLVAADGKIFYAYRDLISFKADPMEWRLLYQARIDRSGRLATVETFRRLLKIGDPSQPAQEQEKAEQTLRDQTAGQGPLECASPAICNGRLYVRLGRGIACFDLRASSL